MGEVRIIDINVEETSFAACMARTERAATQARVPLSIVATFLPGVFPGQYRMGHGVGTYFEATV